jgi:hypothetical protein
MDLTFSSILVVILGILAVIKYGIELYKGVNNPNINQDLEIRSIRENCDNRSETVDNLFNNINKRLDFIEQNSLKHIEKDTNDMGKQMVKLETKLDILLSRK